METNNIKLSIVTPYGEIFDGSIKSVSLPGVDGEFSVLPGHCNLLSLLQAGVIEVINDNNARELIAINWGYAEVSASKVDVLANGAVAISGSTSSEISNAIESAKTLLQEASADKIAISSVISKIESGAKQLL